MSLISKNNQGLKTISRGFFAFVFYFAVMFSFSQVNTVKAQVNPWSFLERAGEAADGTVSAICNPTQAMFAHIALDQPQQSIVRFAYNYDTTRYLKLFYNIFGMSIDNAIRCITKIPGFDVSLVGSTCTLLTGAPAVPNICDGLLLGGQIDPTTAGNVNSGMPFSNNPVSGSLIGLYHIADAAQRYADPPPNLAFFATQEFKHVPFVGKALAQTPSPTYKGLFITKIYFAWKFVRNVAFGMMALVMLVIGVMMINRTKVSSQTIVTVQYALPKVIIAAVLIAFSFPIAATITNVFFLLSLKAPSIVTMTIITDVISEIQNIDPTSFQQSFITPGGSINFVTLLMYALASAFQITTMGPVLFIIWSICVIVIIIRMIGITLKWMITYVKMLIEIVLSPIDLLLSALPGSEEKGSGESKVIKWFKKFLAYGISLVILSAMPVLVLWIGATVIISGMINSTPVGGTFNALGLQIPLPSIGSLATMGAGFDITIFFLVVIMGLSMTSKLPGQVQYMLMGKEPESRK